MRQGENFQSLKRRGCGLINRGIKLLDRAERFAQLLSEIGRRHAKRLQHLLLALGFLLRTRQHVSGLSIDHFQRQRIMRAERSNRTYEHGFQTPSLADLFRHVPRHPLIGRAFHKTQCLADPFVRKDIQERGLLQLHRQRLLESAVERRIAGLVVEIRDQDCVTQSPPVVFEVEEVSKHRGADYQRNQRDRRAALVALDLADEVLGTRCRSRRLFGGLPSQRLSTA